MLLRCGLSLRWEKPRGNGKDSGMGLRISNRGPATPVSCSAAKAVKGRADRQSAELKERNGMLWENASKKHANRGWDVGVGVGSVSCVVFRRDQCCCCCQGKKNKSRGERGC